MVLSLNHGKSIIFRNIHLFSHRSFFSFIAQQKDPHDTLARFSLPSHLLPSYWQPSNRFLSMALIDRAWDHLRSQYPWNVNKTEGDTAQHERLRVLSVCPNWSGLSDAAGRSTRVVAPPVGLLPWPSLHVHVLLTEQWPQLSRSIVMMLWNFALLEVYRDNGFNSLPLPSKMEDL